MILLVIADAKIHIRLIFCLEHSRDSMAFSLHKGSISPPVASAQSTRFMPNSGLLLTLALSLRLLILESISRPVKCNQLRRPSRDDAPILSSSFELTNRRMVSTGCAWTYLVPRLVMWTIRMAWVELLREINCENQNASQLCLKFWIRQGVPNELLCFSAS